MKHLLKSKRFTVRALVSSPSNAKARKMSDLGAEVMMISDSADPALLSQSFRGSHGVYAVTEGLNARYNIDKDVAQGKVSNI